MCHVTVDDHSRYAYVEVLPDECGEATVGFLQRMHAAFARQGLKVERILTDNGSNYRCQVFAEAATALDIELRRTRPYRPQTKGKAEAFIKTLQREWARQRPYSSNAHRLKALQPSSAPIVTTDPTPASLTTLLPSGSVSTTSVG